MDCLHYLTQQGLTITIKEDYLIVEPKTLLTDELRNYITIHKETIKEQCSESYQNKPKRPQTNELTRQQQLWLNQIANILKVTSDYLLEHQLIDEYDLVELVDKEPALVANAIKTGCYWIKHK